MNWSKSLVSRTVMSIALSSVTFACSDSGTSESQAEPSGRVEIFSWWVGGGEVDALNALLAVNQTQNPKVTVKNLTEDHADDARDRLQQRMAEGAPPDTFQANIGADLFKWVLFDGVDDSDSKVEALNPIAEKNGWLDVFPKAVVEAVSYKNSMYAVPANIHRLNSLFYNVKILQQEQLTAPDSLDDLLSVSAALKDKGYVPLCIGGEQPWTLAILAFDNVFVAVAGASYAQDYWKGNKTAAGPEMQASLDYLQSLWPYFNQDANRVSWTAGIDHMFDAQSPCVMTVMGDWAKGYLASKGWVPGTDFQQIPFPGSRGTFVFGGDSFPLPKGAPNRPAAVALLETFASLEGQIAFNKIKGSIPVRTDIDPKTLDVLAQKTAADFKADTLVGTMTGVLPQNIFDDLAPAVQDMLNTNEQEGMLNALANDYAEFR